MKEATKLKLNFYRMNLSHLFVIIAFLLMTYSPYNLYKHYQYNECKNLCNSTVCKQTTTGNWCYQWNYELSPEYGYFYYSTRCVGNNFSSRLDCVEACLTSCNKHTSWSVLILSFFALLIGAMFLDIGHSGLDKIRKYEENTKTKITPFFSLLDVPFEILGKSVIIGIFIYCVFYAIFID